MKLISKPADKSIGCTWYCKLYFPIISPF